MYRTHTLRLRLNQAQTAAFEEILRDSADTYNAGLQERKEAWKLERKQIGLYDQFAELTELRKDERFAKIAVDIQREPLRCCAQCSQPREEACGLTAFRMYRGYRKVVTYIIPQ